MILVGYREHLADFKPDTLQSARALADQATLAIHNARLFENTDFALTRRVDELAALEMISQRMTRRLDLRTVIEQVVKAAAVATGAEVSELLMLTESQKTLEPVERIGLGRDQEVDLWPAEEGIVGRALRTGQPIIVQDVTQDPDYVSTLSSIRSEMAVPIALEHRQLGVINLESTHPNAFDGEQARFIGNLAEHAAIAIQNARLFETVQKRADEFQTLRSIAVELLSSIDFKHTLRVIARQAMTRVGAQDVHIYLYDQVTEELTFGTSLWRSGEVDVEFATPRPDGITATVARNGERLIVTQPAEHPLFEDMVGEPGWDTIQTMVSVPLKRGNEVLGVFNIAFDDRNKLTEDELHFLDLLASQAAVAIANARLTEQTRTGRDRLQAILDSIHDGILMFDMHGRLVLANPRVEYLLGIRISDYLDDHFVSIIRSLSKEHGADAFLLSNVTGIVKEISDIPTSITRREYTLNTPSFRVIDEMSIPVTSQAGQIIGRLFIMRDVTSEHEMEAYRQEMSNMIVHDLRSPLAGVITGLNLALEESAFVPTSEHQEMIDASLRVALQSSNTLLRLVEGMLDVNKLEMGEVPLRLEELRLRSMAERAVEMLQGTADEASIDLSIESPPDLAPIRADADKLERVFVNLLDNALRYTPEGGRVRVEIEQVDKHQQISIIDTGDGIPPELRERVFERFYQGDISRRKRGAKGTGLGLTFCRLVVEAHGGRIWAGEGPEGGAAIRFTLPLDINESDNN
jgi:NtrC-family two-component system sensor histidine kinase KinB